MLVLMTASETKASKGRPTMTSARPMRKRTLLTKVKTFSRTMAAYVRVVAGGAAVAQAPGAPLGGLLLAETGGRGGWRPGEVWRLRVLMRPSGRHDSAG